MCLKGDLDIPELAERGLHRFVVELHLKDRRAAGRPPKSLDNQGVGLLNIGTARAAGSASHPLNKLGRSELSTMPKIKPTAGPIRTQPVERVSTMLTPVLPMMPTVGKVGKTPQPKR